MEFMYLVFTRMPGGRYRRRLCCCTCVLLVFRVLIHSLNPFTLPACKISGLKDAQMHLQTVYIFRSYNTSALNAMRFDENPFS